MKEKNVLKYMKNQHQCARGDKVVDIHIQTLILE